MNDILLSNKESRSNRLLYLGFTILGIYLFLVKDYAMAGSNLAIALAFDPFDAKVPFQRRTLHQKLLPITQIAIGILCMGLSLFKII